MGTSQILKFIPAASISISEANSIPPDLRPRFFRAGLVMARRPQWASDMPAEKSRFSIQVRTGLPI